MKKIFGIFNGIPLLLTALSVFVFFYINNDAVQYTTLGYNLFHQGIYNDSYGVVPGWIQAPGWPVLLGFFSFILPLHLLAPLISFIISLIILFLFYSFIKKNFNSDLALLAGGILAINPEYLILSRSGLSEPFYLLIHFILFIVLYKFWCHKKTATFWNGISLALLSLALVFIRSEGILYIPLVFFILFKPFLSVKEEQNLEFQKGSGQIKFGVRSNRTAIYAMALYLLILSAGLIPYGMWVQNKTGQFNIAPKITFNFRIGAVASMLGQDRESDPDELEELSWYGLDEETNELYSSHIMEDAYYKKIKNNIPKGKRSWTQFTLLVSNNLKETIRILVKSNPFPIVFILLIIAGLFFLFKQRRNLLFFIVLWLIPAFYFIISHVQERFFYVMLPYGSLIAAYGIYAIVQKIKRPPILSHAVVFILLINALVYYNAYYSWLQEKEVYYQVAQELRCTVEPDKTICAKEFQTTFYSGNEFIKMPYCSVNAFYRYLIQRKADYVLLGQEVKHVRKMFKPIYDNQISGRFRWVKDFSTSYQEFKLFELLH